MFLTKERAMSAYPITDFIYAQFIHEVKEYAIFATDTRGVITFWNEGAQRLKGYAEAEIVGQFYGVLFPEEYQATGKPQLEIEQALQTGSYEAEDWRKRKDGTLFWAKVNFTPIYGPNGEHLGFTKVTGDLTQHKLYEEELKRRNEALAQKNEQLEKINADLDNFIYTASHDLKTPITNIEGLIYLLDIELTEKQVLDNDSAEILQHVRSAINKFKATIADLTEVSKLQKNISEPAGEELISVADIYEEIMAVSGFLHQSNPCRLSTDFQVPEIFYSKKNFRSVLYNLLSNAFKYQAPDRNCRIEVKTYCQDHFTVLQVSDNGLGMSPQNTEKLFSMFTRFHSHVDGTGIGLYLVKRMVENAGGKIAVTSQENVGTSVRVFFKNSAVKL